MKSIKNFSVGDVVFYYDPVEHVFLDGKIEQKNKKAKFFVPSIKFHGKLRVSNVLDNLYHAEDLPDEAFFIPDETWLISDECLIRDELKMDEDKPESVCCCKEGINTDPFDVVVELESSDDCVFDALDVFIEYANDEGRTVLCKLVYPNGESHYFVISESGAILGAFKYEDDAINFIDSLDSEEEDIEEDIEEEIEESDDYEESIFDEDDHDFLCKVESEILSYLDNYKSISEKVRDIIESLDNMKNFEFILNDILKDIKESIKSNKND